ncbi:MAG: uracil-DNA glycosylase family protein [Pseudomonadota bacterium]
MLENNLQKVHPSWQPIVNVALQKLSSDYVIKLYDSKSWLPGLAKFLNAFSLPINKTRIILFGESPYPRAESANGYAFWDASVSSIWSTKGLSKTVNRATSLRNFVKMLLVSGNYLTSDAVSQPAIVTVDKTQLVQTLDELFENLINHGFLLLNTSLVYDESHSVAFHVKAWRPFIASILEQLASIKPNITLLLLGRLAATLDKLAITQKFQRFYAPHPYNLSFIANTQIQAFFRPFNLLVKSDYNVVGA